MKKTRILLIICACVFACAIVLESVCFLCYIGINVFFPSLVNYTKQIGIKIDKNFDTAMELSEYGLQAIATNGFDKKSKTGWIVTDISMDLNENEKGSIILTYTKGINDSSVIILYFDTYNAYFDKMEYYKSAQKLTGWNINFCEWKVDSDKAIEIAKETLDKDYIVKEIVVGVADIYDGRNVWHVDFSDNEKNKVRVSIDAYTGEIVKSKYGE